MRSVDGDFDGFDVEIFPFYEKRSGGVVVETYYLHQHAQVFFDLLSAGYPVGVAVQRANESVPDWLPTNLLVLNNKVDPQTTLKHVYLTSSQRAALTDPNNLYTGWFYPPLQTP